jgi:Uma2 family endonuclease
MATKAFLTVEDFVSLPESAGSQDVQYEIVEGELISVAPAMLPHNLVRDNFVIALKPFVNARKLGTVVAEQPFHLFAGTIRVPDVAFVRAEREVASERPIEGAPDLAIEVVSPSNTPREIDRRISDYFAGGCRRVWVAYFDEREVHIHGLAGITRRGGNDLLEDAELLPGFSVKVSDLFV